MDAGIGTSESEISTAATIAEIKLATASNDWIKLRKYKLKLNLECEDCLRQGGRIWPATEVHHILKIVDRPDYGWIRRI